MKRSIIRNWIKVMGKHQNVRQNLVPLSIVSTSSSSYHVIFTILTLLSMKMLFAAKLLKLHNSTGKQV